MANYTHKFAMELDERVSFHEEQYNLILDEKKYYVLRFDGVKMTKNFLSKPEMRKTFFKTIRESITSFMNNNEGLNFAYSFSDEISVFLSDKVLKEYDYRLQKIISILSSQLGFIFGANAYRNRLDLDNKIRCFDCRIIEFDELESVKDYFVSRQVFQISSHFLRLKHSYIKDFIGNNTNVINNKLKQVGVYYEKLPKAERYGLIWVNGEFIIPYEFIENEDILLSQLKELELEKSK